ncbi:MarR family transcriptional regulator [Sphaerisporangium rufum]|uniref:MarR family transcriptional regulator n=1 Tax=Sphaerisporangium rufum TaxID=1381558 RepID=UPI001EF1A587|nr:helix-turn-helix domain-containing protein [Sphaerisporangium rufum]
MNGVELFLLGRTLMKIGEEAIPREGIGEWTTSVRTVVIVLLDVVEHDNSSIGEIAARTGLPQSRVSESVARLRQGGSVLTFPDPADRRRMLVRRAPEMSARVAVVAGTPVDGAVASAIGTAEPARVTEIVELLERLAGLLTPEAIARLRAPRR